MSAACPRLGFEVRIEPRTGVPREVFAALCADFLARVVTANELTHTGGGQSAVYTLSREGMQATDADRELVRRWADAHAGELRASIGPLIDLDG